MKSSEDDAEWIWDRNKFLNRKFLMQEMYQNYVDGDDWDVPEVSTWLHSSYAVEGWCVLVRALAL